MSKLLEHRRRADLTQFELAHRAGISLSQYADIESGKADPRLNTLRKIAYALGVTVGDLVPAVQPEDAPVPSNDSTSR